MSKIESADEFAVRLDYEAVGYDDANNTDINWQLVATLIEARDRAVAKKVLEGLVVRLGRAEEYGATFECRTLLKDPAELDRLMKE